MTEKILEKEKEQIPEQKCHRWANMNAHYIKKKKKKKKSCIIIEIQMQTKVR